MEDLARSDEGRPDAGAHDQASTGPLVEGTVG